MDIHVSFGNTKVGKVMNLSLPPIVSCADDVPCAAGCYAMRSYRRFGMTRKAWDENLRLWRTAPKKFERQLFDILREADASQPCFFRWHVGGDIPDGHYLVMMIVIAERFPHIKFLAFTKQYKIIADCGIPFPDNLSIVVSAWPHYPLHNPRALPVAWMQDGTEDRIPPESVECSGLCENCGMCWSLKDLKKDVVMLRH